jgi:DUF1680 family protein
VLFEVSTARRLEFAMNFRIPSWAEGASIFVNGKGVLEPVIPGRFATVRRQWKTGDRIELDLPLTKRLEPIDADHPKTVALLYGPLVLFAITNTPPLVTSRQLLAAKKTGQQNWQVETSTAALNMLPFTAISNEQYSTYLLVK